MAENARNPDALNEEIERTRDELARTIDTIVDRAHPKNVARRSTDQLKENASQLKENATAMRGKLPQRHTGDFHAQLAHRESESSSAGAHAAGSLQATGDKLRANRVYVLAGAGLSVLVVAAVVVWRRTRH